ncbi:MAG: metal-dependent hydrolase [Myxococcota bacterium]
MTAETNLKEIEMVVRRPEFAFADSPHNWMPANPAFGYELNGGSLILPYLEPYLIRVMKQAKDKLAGSNPRLAREIDLFNGQEANHYRLHAGYNAMLRERYEGLEEIEAEIEADFARMLREESLEWNLGYSAGFETTGMVTAELFFRAAPESLEGADPAVAGLWGWHLAEEFEHRCVAFDVYQALVGHWRERVRMFLYQSRHLRGFGTRAAQLMREQDAARGLTPTTPTTSVSRAQKRIERKQALFAIRRIGVSLLPGHEPRNAPDLHEAEAFLSDLAWT